MAFPSGLHGVLGACFLFCRAHRPVLWRQTQTHVYTFSTLLGTNSCVQISRGGALRAPRAQGPRDGCGRELCLLASFVGRCCVWGWGVRHPGPLHASISDSEEAELVLTGCEFHLLGHGFCVPEGPARVLGGQKCYPSTWSCYDSPFRPAAETA